MAKPVVFAMQFTADTSDLKSLGDVESDLKAISTAATDASGELDNLSSTDIDIDINDQAIDNAQTRIRELQREISDAKSMDIDADVSKAKKAIGRLESDINALKKGRNKIPVTVDPTKFRQGLSHLKEETAQSGREAGASFSGGFEGAIDFGQEVLAQALGGFGAVGAAAGLVAAIGIGQVTAEIEEVNAATEKWAETFRQLATDGQTGADAITTILQSFTAGETAQIAKDLEAAGIAAKDYYAAIADPTGATAELVRQQIGAGSVLGGVNEIWDEGERASVRLQDGLTRAAAGYSDAEKAAGLTADATSGYAKATDTATVATEEQKTAQDYLNEALKTAETDLNNAKSAVDDYFGALGQGAADQDSYTESLYRLGDSIEKNGKSFKGNSEKALANRDAMRDVASQAGTLLKKMADNGAGADTLAAKTKALRDQFVTQAQKMGLSKTAAEKLATQYGLVPSTVKTTITQSGMEKAQAEVTTYKGQLDAEDGRTVTTYMQVRIQRQQDIMTDRFQSGAGALLTVPPPQAATATPDVRVFIAGREVEATVQGSMARARESESLYGLMGFGPKRYRGV